MADDATIAKVKVSLRIYHAALDDEIADQIDACKADLTMVGIATVDETDPLTLSAIKNWCRSENASDPADAKAYRDAYDAQKTCLLTATGYGLPEDETV